MHVRVLCLVMDGPATHRKMLNILGADLDNGTATFPHPCEPSLPVYGLLDVVHMLKLVRNSWAGYEVLFNSEGDRIEWKFIEKLHELQTEEGFRLGNRLRNKHIKWRDMKMKVL